MLNNTFLIKQVLSVLLVTVLTGCCLGGRCQLDDMRFTEVSTVNLLDHPEVIWLGGERPSLQLLRISFETKENLESFAKRYEFHTSNILFFCADGPEKYQRGLGQFSDVYTSRGTVSPYHDETDMQAAGPRGTFVYQIYVELTRKSRLNGVQQTIPAYDLRQPPGDLCAQIQGGNMVGGGYESNIFTIPALVVTAAKSEVRESQHK